MLKERLKKDEGMWSVATKKAVTPPFSHAASIGFLAALCLALAGCGGPQRAKPVEVDLARETLTRVLEHWKNGGTIGDLRKQRPEIIVQELEWTNGRKLQDFALVGEPRALNANWFCDVELTLASELGDVPVKKTVKKTVTYAVGTDPVLTVFHSML